MTRDLRLSTANLAETADSPRVATECAYNWRELLWEADVSPRYIRLWTLAAEAFEARAAELWAAEELRARCGEVRAFCEYCDQPIFDGDDEGSSCVRSETGEWHHGRCLYEHGDLAPAGFYDTNDLALQLAALGVDPRSVGRA